MSDQWNHQQPPQQPQGQPGSQPQSAPQQPQGTPQAYPKAPVQDNRPWYKKQRFIIPSTILLLFLGLATLAMVLASVFSTVGGGSAGNGNDEPVVGKPFLVEMGEGNLAEITIVSASYEESVTDNSVFGEPAENGAYLVLDVLWETKEGVTHSNPLYFSAKDSEGREGETEIFADGLIGSGDIPAGDRSRGLVVFDIAQGPTTVTIQQVGLGEVARIQLNP